MIVYVWLFSFALYAVLSGYCIIKRLELLVLKKENGVLVMPGMFFFSAFGGWFFVIVSGIEMDSEWGIGLSVSMLVMLYLIIGVIMLFWFATIVVYDEEGVTVGYLPFFKKYHRYEELRGVQLDDPKRRIKSISQWTLFIGSSQIVEGNYDASFSKFKDKVFSKYQEIYGEELPIIENNPKDELFHGYVKQPAAVILFMVILALAPVLFCGINIYDMVHYVDEEEAAYRKVTIVNYQMEDRSFYLISNENDRYRISNSAENRQAIIDILGEVIDTKKVFYLNVAKPGKRNTYYIYHAVDENGITYMTYDLANESVQKSARDLMPLLLGVTIFTWCYIVFNLCVARNPKKYSKKIIRFLIISEYLIWDEIDRVENNYC